jgi:hypothetical protein
MSARLVVEAPARPGEPRSPFDGVGSIAFTDTGDAAPVEQLPDWGTMGLALCGAPADYQLAEGARPLVGEIGRAFDLAPGESATVSFVLTWYFPNLAIARLGVVGRHYQKRFLDAGGVARYVAGNYQRLRDRTRLWRDTWYDSTLPFWFLDRTMVNTSSLASSTSTRFASGRFWGWEGVNSYPGTCTHVWGYAQAVARLFPEIERGLREHVDYGLALQRDGIVSFRADFQDNLSHDNSALDGQAMVILRTLREHQTAKDDSFLKRTWPNAKRAISALIARDPNQDGILDGPQHNTLDSAWYGEVAWLSGLYQAALAAGEQLALVAGDKVFATTCARIRQRGRAKLERDLFDSEYFINRIDRDHLDAINSGTGCLIDQQLGQSWAHQVGLGRVVSPEKAIRALKALWQYNYAPDIGPYRAKMNGKFGYAMPGEPGLLMCTFPRADWTFAQARGTASEFSYSSYFNSCMTGFEYAAASHMVWEGLVMEGLAVTRSVHERYAAAKRNPFNEVEAGDHYSRAMASYGVFLAACGFEYDGPAGRIAFAPRLTPENFRAPFTAAEGWGTYSQKINGSQLVATIELKWGQLGVSKFCVSTGGTEAHCRATLDGREVAVVSEREGGRLTISLRHPVTIRAGQQLQFNAGQI